MTSPSKDDTTLLTEIANLELHLQGLKAQLHQPQPSASPSPSSSFVSTPSLDLHSILLISDSALPLGSFAYSAGLESFLAHTPKPLHTLPSTFRQFLELSLYSLASTSLPYVKAVHVNPKSLQDRDDEYDASVTCTVARRASVGQGRALVGVWEKSLKVAYGSSGDDEACTALEEFARCLKAAPQVASGRSGKAESGQEVPAVHGHLAPLFGCLAKALEIPLPHALYVYLLNHAKTLLSAGVRASLLGPYQAQGILAGEKLRDRIWALVREELEVTVEAEGLERVGQSVPVLDLWAGRHEIVYSRIFNS